MKIFFITFRVHNGATRAPSSDLCQADDEKEALAKEMEKQRVKKKDTSEYVCYDLSALLEKYKIKIVQDEDIIKAKPQLKTHDTTESIFAFENTNIIKQEGKDDKTKTLYKVTERKI